MKLYKLFLIGLFGVLNMAHAMEQAGQKYTLINLPGVGGGGNSNLSTLQQKVFKGTFWGGDISFSPQAIGTIDPSNADLGQQQCLNDFKQKAEKTFSNNDNNIMVGASQGTATLINFLAKKNEAQQKKVKALILEAVLANPNDAILHTVDNVLKPVAYAPFSRWWLPWATKAFTFKNYKPYGKTAIDRVKDLHKYMPVILMHAQNDSEISVNQTRQMYVEMKKNGMNPYLIEIDSHRHTDNLSGPDEGEYSPMQDENGHLKKGIKDFSTSYNHILPLVLQRICKQWNLPRANTLNIYTLQRGKTEENYGGSLIEEGESWSDEQLDTIPLDNYQPDAQVVQEKISQSTWKQRYLHNIIDLAALSAVGAYIYHKFFKL